MLNEKELLEISEFVGEHQCAGQCDRDEFCDDIVETHEPGENFKAICEYVETDDDFSNALILHKVQRQKGQPRTTIYIMDFGHCRGIYEI